MAHPNHDLDSPPGVDVRTVGPRRTGNGNFANVALKRMPDSPGTFWITPEPAMSAVINR